MFGSFVTMVAAPLQLKELTGSYVAVGLVGAVEFAPARGLRALGRRGGRCAGPAPCRHRRRTRPAAALGGAGGQRTAPELADLADLRSRGRIRRGHGRATSESRRVRAAAGRPQPAARSECVDQPAIRRRCGDRACAGRGPRGRSLPAAYGVDVASPSSSRQTLLLRIRPPATTTARVRLNLAAIGEGIRYALRRRDLLGTYLVDIVAMAFAMPQALFPFLADELHQPRALGLLYSAGAAGGVVAALSSGWTARVHRHGLAIVLAATGWGDWDGARRVEHRAAGGAGLSGRRRGRGHDLRGVPFDGVESDDPGRAAGAPGRHRVVVVLHPGRRSATRAPVLMARLGGVRFSIGVGGVLCVGAVGAVAALLPSFLRYDARTDAHAVRERERRTAEAQAGMHPA